VTALTIAAVNLRRALRDRTSLFFLVLFPMLLILVLGVAFGGESRPRLGVFDPVPSTLSRDLVAELESGGGVQVQLFGSRPDAVGAVEQGRAAGALILPPGYADLVGSGRAVTVDYVSQSDRTALQTGAVVAAAVRAQSSRLTVAKALEQRLGGDPASMLTLTDSTTGAVPKVQVRTSSTGEALFPEDLGQFDIGASGQLLLFIFVTSMTAASALIITRSLGVSRRMYAAPTSLASIVAGEALGRVSIAVLQGAIIMVGSSVLFGVSWGDPLAAILLMILFAAVAGGAALLLGAVASNAEQAVAVGLLLGLGMGALGGSMMPLEFFSPAMVTAAHITPHAWAGDGFAELVRHDGGLVDVLPEAGVLALYAVVLFAVAAWGLRRSIVRP
jgi:ABC-2 type transport system permease protein